MQTAIKEIMSKSPTSISYSAMLSDALTIMKKEQLSHLIITDEKNKLQGIISKTDILKYLNDIISKTTGKTYTNLEMNNIPVTTVMSSNPICLEENQTIKEAIILLAKYKLKSLPIIDTGVVIGILTTHDIIKYLSKNLEKL